MSKFRCTRGIIAAEGYQEFELTAKNLKEAKDKFQNGEGELVDTECEIISLEDFDLSAIWEGED